MKKWYEGIYRRQLTDMHINDTDAAFLSELRAEDYYENLVRAKIQSPMIYLHSHVGLCNYKSASGYTHPRFSGADNEVKKLISLCKAGGMKVVGYYSLIFNNRAIEEHPEWEMRRADGTTFRDDGQRYGMCCPNNPEYREFLKGQIDELAENFVDIDGLFFDMPYWEIACACDSCRSRFKREYGEEIPTACDIENPTWLSYVKARQEFMVDFVRFVKEYTAKVMPWVTVEFNYAAVIGCDWMGGSTEGINDECEFTGGDLYGDLYSHSFACKYYYSVTKNQPFEYMTCRCDRSLREHTITKPKEMLMQEVLLTVAHHGASLIIDAIDPDGGLDSRVYDRVGEVFSRQIPFEKYMCKGSLYAEVAVYFDSKTMFSSDGGDKYNRTSAIGAVRNLIEAHIPCTVVANGALDNISRYKVVIAPSLQDFDNDEPLKLIDYVKNGGTLYLSGRSDSRLMKEFFGSRFVGYTYGESKRKKVQQGARVYVRPTALGADMLGEFNEKYPLPLTYNLPLIENAEGDVKAKITLPFADPDESTRFSSIHSCPPWENTDFPAFIERSFGKGKVIWSAAELEYDRRSAFVDIFNSIIEANLDKKYAITAGRAIEMVVFEDEKETLISLCDLMHDSYKKNADMPIVIKDVRKPTSVKNVESGEEISFTYDGDRISLTLNVDDFAMYEIKFT